MLIKFKKEDFGFEIIKFKKEDFGFEKVTGRKGFADQKRKSKNSEKYARWCMKILEETAPRKKKEDEKFTTVGMHMNKHNLDYLSKYMHPMPWLMWSPVTDDFLADDECRIDIWFESGKWVH